MNTFDAMKYPVGIESFEKIRDGGFVYVDKTRYVEMLTQSPGYYFLSRPRRFGKSLFISTMEAYFQGRRDLFEGLAIDKDDIDWTPRPVFKFVFSKLEPTSEDDLRALIHTAVSEWEDVYGRNDNELKLAQRFEGVLKRACIQTGRKVAVLVDEYDAPLLATLEDADLNDRCREIMKWVFVILKASDSYIHTVFITGVSRFSHTSLFSGGNNIPDWTLRDETAAICGITEEELHKCFKPGIEALADENGLSYDRAVESMKQNYDGYHFSRRCPDIYNPSSILQCLEEKRIGEFWFDTGTPSFLMKSLRKDDFELPRLDCIETQTSTLSSKESFLSNPVSLLYESGYLTIKAYDADIQTFMLGIPNIEVGKGLAGALLPLYSSYRASQVDSWVIKMQRAVSAGDADGFMVHVQDFMEGNPYGITELDKRETYFQNNMYLIFKILGFKPDEERQTCSARSDLVLETKRYIYIFELKVDKTPEEALRQIEEKRYARPYIHDGRTIIMIGANYSTSINNIDRWIFETKR